MVFLLLKSQKVQLLKTFKTFDSEGIRGDNHRVLKFCFHNKERNLIVPCASFRDVSVS